MSKSEIKLVNYLNDVEYSFFDQDPDGDEDRAGDGIYFRLPGDDSWDGAYFSETDAEEPARHALFLREQRMISEEMRKDGYFLTDGRGPNEYTIQAKNRCFQIVVDDESVSYHERLIDGGVKEMGEIEYDDMQETFGHKHRAVREALQAVATELGFYHQGVVPRQVYDENAVAAMMVYETIGEIPEDKGPDGLRKWALAIGRGELRYQSLALAEQIDAVYNSFTEFEFDDISFEDDFIPVMLHAFDYNVGKDGTPQLIGGIEGGMDYARSHFGIEADTIPKI